MPDWEELYREGHTLGPHPEGWLVEHEGLLQDPVLDLGCGTGRNTAHLARQGFSVVGTDVSATGLELTRTQAPGVRLALADFHDLPFAAGTFGAVVSIDVLYHTTRAGMQRAMAEIRRVLRAGGVFVGTFISTRTWKYGLGEQIEPNTFVQPEGLEAGVPHHYCDETEVRGLLARFRIERLELDEHEGTGPEPGLHSHWQVSASLDQLGYN